MIANSHELHVLARQVAKRRRDLLRGGGRLLMYPPLGQAWSPDDAQATMAEAFTVLFVAELETYFEWVVETALEVFELSLSASGAGECGGATPYVERIREKQQSLVKNNNANWSKVSHFFEFVGLKKSSFPNDFWDDVELIVRERGNIVHKSLGLRVVSDPRLVLAKVESTFRKLRLFDRDFVFWLSVRRSELTRLSNIHLKFQPGLGSLSTAMPM
jgi:hypothetical protein